MYVCVAETLSSLLWCFIRFVLLRIVCVFFMQLLDKLHMDDRHADRPLRVPVLDRYNDRGTMVLGKVEQVSRQSRAIQQ